jgi:hypothetical protein
VFVVHEPCCGSKESKTLWHNNYYYSFFWLDEFFEFDKLLWFVVFFEFAKLLWLYFGFCNFFRFDKLHYHSGFW